MQFLTTNKNLYSQNLFRLQLMRIARIRIFSYELGPTEILLDKYLKQQYNSDLKTLCLLIVNNVNVDCSTVEEPYIYFSNTLLEQIAKIITFGTG